MKTAIFIEDGITQVVLTPQTDTDKQVIGHLIELSSNGRLQCFKGSFYNCHGGWVRQGSNDDSLIMRVDTPKEFVAAQ